MRVKGRPDDKILDHANDMPAAAVFLSDIRTDGVLQVHGRHGLFIQHHRVAIRGKFIDVDIPALHDFYTGCFCKIRVGPQ